MIFQAGTVYYQQLNDSIRDCTDSEITVENLLGQRYLGCGSSGKTFKLYGTPGNGLGQYLNGSSIEVFGNAQDATGDTMNEGEIIIHGSCGDAAGYGMRGGRILIEGDCGYRGGIHMKSYLDKYPVIVIGGQAGSFLGEYQAGGLIVVLGKGAGGKVPVSYFCGTGMHGGKIFLRTDFEPEGLPPQVICREATAEDKQQILGYVQDFCVYFGGEPQQLLAPKFYVLLPNTKNPYKQLYVNN